MQRGFTLWFTGLPGSGKSALAECVEGALLERGLDIEFLDEEMIRRDFGDELSEDGAGRAKLTNRAAVIANILTRNRIPALVAMTSPTRNAPNTIDSPKSWVPIAAPKHSTRTVSRKSSRARTPPTLPSSQGSIQRPSTIARPTNNAAFIIAIARASVMFPVTPPISGIITIIPTTAISWRMRMAIIMRP